jgi:hypothetical protein
MAIPPPAVVTLIASPEHYYHAAKSSTPYMSRRKDGHSSPNKAVLVSEHGDHRRHETPLSGFDCLRVLGRVAHGHAVIKASLNASQDMARALHHQHHLV